MEFGYVRLADGLVQSSSIMPEKRNPVALEHARALASKALGESSAIVLTVHNTPFGDVVDTEDDLQPLVASMFRDALRAVMLVTAAIRGMELDVARLEARAAVGGTTLTELADHLVRTHDIPFRSAHAIAGRMAKAHRDRPDAPLGATLATVSSDVLGVPLQYSDAEIARITSARHFVAVRRTPGGPAPEETARALGESRRRLDEDRSWLSASRAALARADGRLRERSLGL
jgi:argininosuccinate lyase